VFIAMVSVGRGVVITAIPFSDRSIVEITMELFLSLETCFYKGVEIMSMPSPGNPVAIIAMAPPPIAR